MGDASTILHTCCSSSPSSSPSNIFPPCIHRPDEQTQRAKSELGNEPMNINTALAPLRLGVATKVKRQTPALRTYPNDVVLFRTCEERGEVTMSGFCDLRKKISNRIYFLSGTFSDESRVSCFGCLFNCREKIGPLHSTVLALTTAQCCFSSPSSRLIFSRFVSIAIKPRPDEYDHAPKAGLGNKRTARALRYYSTHFWWPPSRSLASNSFLQVKVEIR